MFALPEHDQTSMSPGAKHRARTPALDGKAEAEPNPLWQSLALRPAAVQTKLAVSRPDDPQERGADQIADRVMRMAAPPSSDPKLSFSSVVAYRQAQRKCAPCEEEEKLQRKEQAGSTEVEHAAPVAHQTPRSSGQPLDPSARAFFEPRFGHDFSGVRVHADSAAARSARSLRARAFTLGQNVVFATGEYDPRSDSGRRLLAHELTHVVQQRSAGPAARVIQRQEAKQDASAQGPKQDAPAPDVPPDPLKVEPVDTKGVAAAAPTFIYNTRGEIVATVDQGTQLKVTGKPKDEDLEKVRKGQYWFKKGDTKPGLYDLYYQVEYFGRMGRPAGVLQDQPIKGYVYTSWLSLTAQPAGPSQAMTNNDWMTIIPEHGQKGDAAAIATSAKAIADERKGIEARAFMNIAKQGSTIPRAGVMSKDDAATLAYKAWLNKADTRPSIAKDANDIRWRAFKRVFPAEGDPSKIMTYDDTNITWGVGFSGAGAPGVGQTEQMMARLFNQSAESRDAFWRAGITVVGTEMVAVKIMDAAAGQAEKLHGTKAENYVREQKELLSLMTNVTLGLIQPGQKEPNAYVRQKNLDAQFETFLHNTLQGSEGIIEGMSGDEVAAAVAAHSVHSGQHSWGQYKGVSDITGVEAAIDARIKVMEQQNKDAADKKEKPKFPFIIPRSQIEAHIKS